MNQHGRVWRVGADIDTDALAPGAYMKFGIDEIARHCLQRVRPDFAAGVRPGDVLVAGPNSASAPRANRPPPPGPAGRGGGGGAVL